MLKKFLNGLLGHEAVKPRPLPGAGISGELPCIGRRSDLIPVSADIGRIVSARSTISETYQKIASQVRESLHYDRLTITVLDFGQNSFRNAFVMGPAIEGIEQGNVFQLRGSFVYDAATAGKAIRIDPSTQYLDQESFSNKGHLSRIATPLIANDEVVGTLHLTINRANAYTDQDLKELERVGNQISDAVYNSTLVKAERDRNNQLEALYRVAAILSQPQTLEAKTEAILATLVRIVNADRAVLRRADEDNDCLSLVAVGGNGNIRFESTIAISDQSSATSRAYREGRVFLINNYQESSGFMESMQKQGVGSILVIPIKSRGMAFGSLTVASMSENHFGNEQVALLNVFADELGVVFDTAKLSESLQASRDEMASVDEIARIITSTLEIEEVYDQFAIEAKKLVEFDRVNVGVIDQDGATISIRYSFGPVVPGHELGQVLSLNSSNNLVELAKGIPVFIDDLQLEAQNAVDQNYLASGFRSSAVIPLISKGRAIGSLGFRSMKPRLYGPKAQEMMIRLANQIAPAVENAQLYAERIRTEEALQASVARAQAVMDTAADGIITISQSGIIETFNQAAEYIFGYGAAEVVGHSVSMLMPEPDKSAHSGYLSMFLGAYESKIIGSGREVLGLHKNGSQFPMDLSVGVVEIGHTKVFTGIVRDISERKAVEARLNESNRLASIGELAAGVAHEINNPLAAIMLASDFISKSGNVNESKEDLDVIFESAQRAAKIVQNMLLFARKTEPDSEPMTIDSIAIHALELKTYDFNESNIKCHLEINGELPTCLIDKDQMGQVILNVINNAEHALVAANGGGNITIEITPSDGSVLLEIRDDGPGIPTALTSKIFEPFFTTKPVGEGTGMGLSICYGIIQQHKGEFWAENNEGGGASFFIQLPAAEREHISKRPRRKSHEDTDISNAQILVVDDETVILNVVRRGLTGTVGAIDEASTGEETLQMINKSDYDCILLDLRMPGMSGMELYEKIAIVDPQLAERIIFMTGDTASQEAADFLNEKANPIVAKPFHLDDVILAIGSVIQTSYEPLSH